MSLDENQRQIERAIRQQKPGLLSGLPGEKKKQLIEFLQNSLPAQPSGQVVLTAQSQTQITSSPVPPAELLEGYNAAIPNGAERLFALVETQSAHRQKIETIVVEGQARRSDWGQRLAFVLCLTFGGIALYFGSIGQAWLAGITLTTTLGGIITTFVLGQKQQERNLDKKAPGKPAAPKRPAT